MSISAATTGGLGLGGKKLLFNAGSLRDLLGLKVEGKAKPKNGKVDKPTYEFIQTILREETGILNLKRKPAARKKKKKKNSLGSLTQTGGGGGGGDVAGGSSFFNNSHALDNARAAHAARNSIHAFASTLGIPREDTAYLERQFAHVKKIILSTSKKLKESYEVRLTIQLVSQNFKDKIILYVTY